MSKQRSFTPRQILPRALFLAACAAPMASAQPAQVAQPASSKAAVHPSPAKYVALGNLYYEQGNYPEAYAAFRSAAEAEPQNSAALLGLGRTLIRLRQYVPAVDTLKRLSTQEPQNVSAQVALAQAYQAQYVGTSDRSKLDDVLGLALSALDKAEAVSRSGDTAQLDVNLSKVYNERGYIYRLQGKYPQAIAAFQKASSLNPDNGIILYNLGDMYYAAGNLPQAVNSLQLAVVADPADAYNRAYYAKLLALSGNITAAQAEAAQAAKLAPKNPYAMGQYGAVLYLAGDKSGARAQLQSALRLEPLRYPEFYYYLGRLELDQANLKDARSDLAKAVALASTNAEYFSYLGLSYERGTATVPSDPARARDAYNKALALQPGLSSAQSGLERLK